jgi:AAA domain
MALKLSTTRAAVAHGLKILVHAPAGSGKTVLCATTPDPANTVIVSHESGLLSIADADIPVMETRTLKDVHEAYLALRDDPQFARFTWVCIDSISDIAEALLLEEKRGTPDPRKAYGALADQMADLIRGFRDLPGRNVYMSCKQERVKDESSGVTLFGPMMPGNALKQGISYFFDEVFALRVEKNPADGSVYRVLQTGRDFNFEAKDRSGKLDMWEPPSLAAIAAKILAPRAGAVQSPAQQ